MFEKHFLGIPSLGVPSIDPVEIKEYHLKGGISASFGQHYYNCLLYGCSQMTVSDAQ